MTYWAPRPIGNGNERWVRYPMPQLVAMWRERCAHAKIAIVEPTGPEGIFMPRCREQTNTFVGSNPTTREASPLPLARHRGVS